MVAVDTNIIIYYLADNPEFGQQARSFFKELVELQTQTFTSIITLTELLSFPFSEGEVAQLKASFSQLITPIEITEEIAAKAGEIRRKYKFHLGDSLQLATAVLNEAEYFITNDKQLLKFPEIPIISLSEVNF